MPGGYVQTRILPYELGIFIEEKAELYIPAFKGSLVFEHATVVSEEELEAALSAEKKGIDGQREVFPYGDLSDFQNFHEDGGESR